MEYPLPEGTRKALFLYHGHQYALFQDARGDYSIYRVLHPCTGQEQYKPLSPTLQARIARAYAKYSL